MFCHCECVALQRSGFFFLPFGAHAVLSRLQPTWHLGRLSPVSSCHPLVVQVLWQEPPLQSLGVTYRSMVKGAPESLQLLDQLVEESVEEPVHTLSAFWWTVCTRPPLSGWTWYTNSVSPTCSTTTWATLSLQLLKVKIWPYCHSAVYFERLHCPSLL